MDLDMDNRDPNNLNDHMKCQFEEVLAEPEGIRSIDCIWSNSYKCFNCWKGCCYKLSSFLCGICIAAELGCEFAAVAFNHVWCLTPCMNLCHMCCKPWQTLLSVLLDCCIASFCETLGRLLSQINVTNVGGGGPPPRGGGGAGKKRGTQQRLAF